MAGMGTKVAAAAMAAMVGCAGAPTTGGETKSCTLTLSGAITGTWDCRPATTTWQESIDEGIFRFTVPQTASTPAVDVQVAWTGQPKVQHYRSGDSDAQAGLTIQDSQQRSWHIVAGSSSAGVTGGSYDLDIAAITSSGPYYIGQEYTITGTLDASLVGTGGASDLTMHVAF